MTWTTPKTWAVGDAMTAADMNVYVRDNSNDVAARIVNGTLGVFTTAVTVSAPAAGVSLQINKEAASLGAGSAVITRSAVATAQSLVFGNGPNYSAVLGRAASSDDLEIGRYNGATYTKLISFSATGGLSVSCPATAVAITLTNAQTGTAASAGAATALPANPSGYLFVSINGTTRNVPYYA